MRISDVAGFISRHRFLSISAAVAMLGTSEIVAKIHPTFISASSAARAIINAEEIGRVDFSKRKLVSSFAGSVDMNTRAARFGEYHNIVSAAIEYNRLSKLNHTLLPGNGATAFSEIAKKGSIHPTEDICVISSKQNATYGDFYEYKNPLIDYEKNKFDFYIQSHETYHCFFILDKGSDDSKDPDKRYYSSIIEVSADLAAELDYRRVTGREDLFKDVIKPYRMSNPTDLSHTTAYAIEVILREVDTASLMSKSADEMPGIVNELMEKHFKIGEHGYDTANIEIDEDAYPGIAALRNEYTARLNLTNREFSNPEVISLKQDIRNTMAGQLESYRQKMPEDLYEKTKTNQALLFKKYEIGNLDVTPNKRLSASMSEVITEKGILAHYTKDEGPTR